MKVNWENPYAGATGSWRHGNLHTHTDKSACGKLPLATVLDIYKGMNYAFLAVTDHNVRTDLPKNTGQLTVFSGIEIDIRGGSHFGVVNTDPQKLVYEAGVSQQELINRNAANGALVTLHHPDWQQREHYLIDELYALNGFDGIEIYNSVIEVLDGAANSTAKWDRLLASGRRVLGFANQDFHDKPHAVDCCNAVRTVSSSPDDVFSALKSGNFYCHYGVCIDDIGRNGDSIFVKTKNSKLIRFIGNGGVIFKKVKGTSAEFTMQGNHKYVRVECLGEGEEISWSQPFFKE